MWRHLFEGSHHHPTGDEVKYVADAVSVGIAAGSLLGFLPAIAALLTIVWTGIRIWETETVQKFFRPKDDKSD